MVEIPTSSCDDFSTDERFLAGYGMQKSGAHVVKLFTKSRKDNEGCMVPLERKPKEKQQVFAPELVSVLSQNNLTHLQSLDLGSSRSSVDGIRCKNVSDSRMALIRDESDSSRECLYTPPEVASTSVLSFSSPDRKLQEFAQELARIKAERCRQRSALREQVLSEIDIPSTYHSESASSSLLVPKNPGTVSEQDDPYSVSSRSSEENLTFQDATDELNDDDDSSKEHFEDKQKSSSDSVDFSFLHSVYHAKGKHEEAILLRMKYAGNKGRRTEKSDHVETTDTTSSNSILGTVPLPGQNEEIVKEYKDLLRETLRKCTTGVAKHRFHERSPTPEMESPSASGSTTPRQRRHCSSKGSSFPTSNRSSKTSVEAGPPTRSPPQVISLPPTQPGSSSVSEHSSPSVSRSVLPQSKIPALSSRSPSPVAPLQQHFDGSPHRLDSHQSESHDNPVWDSPLRNSSRDQTHAECPASQSPRLSSYHEYPTSESPEHSTYHEYSTSGSPLRSIYYEYPASESPRLSTYCDYPASESPPLSAQHEYAASESPLRSAQNSGFHECALQTPRSHGHHGYPISECDTEDDCPFRSDRSDKSSRKKPLKIPITIDGRVVYPEVVFAEDTQTARPQGPLGLLDRVKSFAPNCGSRPTGSKAPSPVLQSLSDGCPEGGKTSVKLNAALLSRLTCVECGSLCTPPVAMCVWGHIVCEECRPVSLWESHGTCWCRKRCPHCSGDMLTHPCDLWSNIARSLLYPCRFTSNGCRETQGLTPDKKLLHEQACLWRQLRCWCPGCSWRGFWHQLRAHVIRIHLSNATRADWYRFVTVGGAHLLGRSSDVIALPANELVLLHSLAVIGEHRYLLQYLNDDGGGGAVLFVPRFKLRVISKDGRSEVEVRGDAVPGRHDVERALRSGKCFRLSGTPFGHVSPDETAPLEDATVQLCLEKGRLSVS